MLSSSRVEHLDFFHQHNTELYHKKYVESITLGKKESHEPYDNIFIDFNVYSHRFFVLIIILSYRIRTTYLPMYSVYKRTNHFHKPMFPTFYFILYDNKIKWHILIYVDVELEEKYVNSIVAFYSNFNSDFLAHERKLGEKNLEARYAK